MVRVGVGHSTRIAGCLLPHAARHVHVDGLAMGVDPLVELGRLVRVRARVGARARARVGARVRVVRARVRVSLVELGHSECRGVVTR